VGSPGGATDVIQYSSPSNVVLRVGDLLIYAKIHLGIYVNTKEFYRLSYQGKPNLSWLMLQQAVQLAQDIGLFMLPRSKHRFREKMTAEMERSRTITAWGIFSLNRSVMSHVVESNGLRLTHAQANVNEVA
jgi:hypothetical protein